MDTATAPEQAIEVLYLGEDTELWIVLGTHQIDEARDAVEALLRADMPDMSDESTLHDAIAYLREDTGGQARDDWYWEDLPSGDALLRTLLEHPTATNPATFEGVFFS